MIGSTRNVRVYAFPAPTDMRKSYDGLFGLVRHVLGEDPLSGHMFLFVAKNRRSAKVLLYDGTGLCIYSKRLQRGLFVAPWERCGEGPVRMTQSELALFLEGSQAVCKNLSPEPYLARETLSYS
ncbi:MAG TPA: IS66 family insertion sequence element accessory protein TnpB [Myxococcota bacterium]|nr:IS66 family insertion sequence element accessory protein TnpB [Myxococcota bacterium]